MTPSWDDDGRELSSTSSSGATLARGGSSNRSGLLGPALPELEQARAIASPISGALDASSAYHFTARALPPARTSTTRWRSRSPTWTRRRPPDRPARPAATDGASSRAGVAAETAGGIGLGLDVSERRRVSAQRVATGLLWARSAPAFRPGRGRRGPAGHPPRHARAGLVPLRPERLRHADAERWELEPPPAAPWARCRPSSR